MDGYWSLELRDVQYPLMDPQLGIGWVGAERGLTVSNIRAVVLLYLQFHFLLL